MKIDEIEAIERIQQYLLDCDGDDLARIYEEVFGLDSCSCEYEDGKLIIPDSQE